MPTLDLIQYRRGTASAWTTANPTLAEGEIGYETDTYEIKIGDGATAWNSRAYFAPGGGGGTWGSITGTLSAQTDLQTALNLKLDASAVSAFGLTLIDDANASTARTTLGLGTLATQSGTFSGTSSGTNTGDQTITLTGDVTGSGTGSFAATIANNAVTLAKMATMATASLLGRNTAGTGNVEVITQASLPVSTATQTALNLKANLASPTFTGTVTTAALTTNGVTTHTDEVRLNATTPYLVFQNSGVQKGLIYTTSNIMFLNASDAAGEFRMQINGGTYLRQQTNLLTISTPILLNNLAADPAGGSNGQMYYNTATNKFRGYAAGAWIDLH